MMYRPRKTISEWCDDFLGTCQEQELRNPSAFTPPLYNVWKQQTKTNAERFSNCATSHTLPFIAQSLTLLEHTLKLSA